LNARHDKPIREALLARVKIDAPSGRTEALPEADQNNPIDQIRLERASVWANVFARVNINAPIPSYEIDAIALDYCAKGLLPFASQLIDKYKTTGLTPTNGNAVWLVRKSVVIGAYCGIYMLEDQSKKVERLQLTKSHFEEIRRDGLERIMIRRRDGGDGDEIRDLFKAFEQIDIAIDKYLKAYEPRDAPYTCAEILNDRHHYGWPDPFIGPGDRDFRRPLRRHARRRGQPRWPAWTESKKGIGATCDGLKICPRAPLNIVTVPTIQV